MEQSPKEALTHTLALVFVAGLLILAAMALGSLKLTPPSWMSQAATATTAATVSDELPPGQCRIFTTVSQYTDYNVHYACYQTQGDETLLLSQTCSKGMDYTVEIAGGKTKVTATARIPRPANCGLLTAAQKCTSGTLLESIDDSPGQVFYKATAAVGGSSKSAEFGGLCGDNSKLGEIKEPTTDRKLSELAVAKVLAQFEPEQLPEAMSQLGVSRESAFLNDAFKDVNTLTNNELSDLGKQIQTADERIAEIASGCPQGCEGTLSNLKAERAQLGLKQAELEALKGNIARLTPAQTPPGGEDIPGGGDPGPTGPTGPTGFNQPTGGPPSGGEKQGGGLEQLLQGLMKALGGQGGGQGGGQPPPGNQNPQTPGTCNPQLVCAGNTLYSRNTQCVDTPVQQCPNGCSGNACKTAPTQPGQPTAQLSCQPQVADAGMMLTISWGCSAGTSVGSGFSTGAERSGSATTTLSTPPTGANHISFGLTCTSEGLSASASCDVQVGKPAIVLVANPKSVTSGGISQLGWVSAGMKECTISSPQQADFTSSNAARTNVSGVAESSPVTEETTFLLTCETQGGNTRSASTTVSVL